MPTEIDELDLQVCPGCERKIADYHSVCPHCQYDIDNNQPAKKKEPKAPKTPKVRTKVKEEIAEANQVVNDTPPKSGWRPPGRYLIAVPALGRPSRPPIDFPELHWKKGVEPTDDNLREWGEALRQAYPKGAEDSQGWLSNHAIGYLADHATGPNDLVLRKNWQKIVELIGGDDY